MEGFYLFDGYTDKGNESYKFWDLTKIDDDLYEANWGRVGRDPLGYKEYTYEEVIKVVKSKKKKGYRLLTPHEHAELLG